MDVLNITGGIGNVTTMSRDDLETFYRTHRNNVGITAPTQRPISPEPHFTGRGVVVVGLCGFALTGRKSNTPRVYEIRSRPSVESPRWIVHWPDYDTRKIFQDNMVVVQRCKSSEPCYPDRIEKRLVVELAPTMAHAQVNTFTRVGSYVTRSFFNGCVFMECKIFLDESISGGCENLKRTIKVLGYLRNRNHPGFVENLNIDNALDFYRGQIRDLVQNTRYWTISTNGSALRNVCLSYINGRVRVFKSQINKARTRERTRTTLSGYRTRDEHRTNDNRPRDQNRRWVRRT